MLPFPILVLGVTILSDSCVNGFFLGRPSLANLRHNPPASGLCPHSSNVRRKERSVRCALQPHKFRHDFDDNMIDPDCAEERVLAARLSRDIPQHVDLTSDYVVTAYRSDRMPLRLQKAIFDLTQSNMQEMYSNSSWGWSDADKKAELQHSQARFLVALTQGPSSPGQLAGFVHYRYELESAHPPFTPASSKKSYTAGELEEMPHEAVIYVYELQVHTAASSGPCASCPLRPLGIMPSREQGASASVCVCVCADTRDTEAGGASTPQHTRMHSRAELTRDALGRFRRSTSGGGSPRT